MYFIIAIVTYYNFPFFHYWFHKLDGTKDRDNNKRKEHETYHIQNDIHMYMHICYTHYKYILVLQCTTAV